MKDSPTNRIKGAGPGRAPDQSTMQIFWLGPTVCIVDQPGARPGRFVLITKHLLATYKHGIMHDLTSTHDRQDRLPDTRSTGRHPARALRRVKSGVRDICCFCYCFFKMKIVRPTFGKAWSSGRCRRARCEAWRLARRPYTKQHTQGTGTRTSHGPDSRGPIPRPYVRSVSIIFVGPNRLQNIGPKPSMSELKRPRSGRTNPRQNQS
jgi:hypothetical protein